MNELHLFAGAGGGILGGLLLGHRPVCAVEIEPACREILLARQRDGLLPRFPIWDDITTFDARPWRGRIDTVCGGFPCQDISTAGGPNRAGIQGARSGLWGHMARVVREVGAREVFVENSPALTFRGLGIVLGDLAAMGFNARWGVYSGGDVGARHQRERIWILGRHRDSAQISATKERRIYEPSEGAIRALSSWNIAESQVGRKVDGVAGWMDRLGALGNGQIPQVVELAYRELGKNWRMR